MTDMNNPLLRESLAPQALSFGWVDILKVLWELVFAFRRTISLEPGLYYTGGAFDLSAPLLVTSNYHLTVWSVWRKIKHLRTRILIIDTDGINVWCSAGKGKFSATEIVRQVDRYPRELLVHSNPDKRQSDTQVGQPQELLREVDEIKLILPKLALSGVSLAELRQKGIKPVIGPVYAGDIPAFIENPPYQDCNKQRFEFDLADRCFTLPSTWMQIAVYSVMGAIVLGIMNIWLQTGIWWQVVPLSLGFATLYILLFPWLFTNSFVYKSLTLFFILGLVIYRAGLHLSMGELVFYQSFLAGFSLFFGLYYTGNSGVSNYSMVKRETVVYLPLAIICFCVALAAVILKGVGI